MVSMSTKKLSTPPVVRHDLMQCPFCGSSPEIEYWHGVTGENERAAIAKWERRV